MWQTLGSIGQLVGGLGSAYGAYRTSQLAKEQLEMQRQNYLRNLKLQQLGQANLKAGLEAVYGQPQPLGTYSTAYRTY